MTALALSTTAVPVAVAQTETPTSPIGSDPVRRAPKPALPEDDREEEEDANELDPELSIDLAHIDPADAAIALGRGLALALNNMRPLGATHIASTWALSTDAVRRLAVAHALEWIFPLVGDGVVIDHLARDSSPEIRVAAARAAWARRSTGGDPGVLDRLSDDPDPEVRTVAVSARS